MSSHLITTSMVPASLGKHMCSSCSFLEFPPFFKPFQAHVHIFRSNFTPKTCFPMFFSTMFLKKHVFFIVFPMLWLNFCNFPRKSGVLDCLAFFSMVFPSFFQPFRGLGGRRFRRFRGDSEHRQRLRRAFGARALATVLHLDEGRGTAKAHGQQQRQLCGDTKITKWS